MQIYRINGYLLHDSGGKYRLEPSSVFNTSYDALGFQTRLHQMLVRNGLVTWLETKGIGNTWEKVSNSTRG